MEILDSIFGDNIASADREGHGYVSTAEYSLFETTAGLTFGGGPGNKFGVDPGLDPLTVWPSPASPTKVHPLKSNSPAVNVKSTSSSVDQRGFGRCKGSATNKCDIGAFERQ